MYSNIRNYGTIPGCHFVGRKDHLLPWIYTITMITSRAPVLHDNVNVNDMPILDFISWCSSNFREKYGEPKSVSRLVLALIESNLKNKKMV